MRTAPVALAKVVPFNLADIGEAIAEVELVQWYVEVGDTVEQFDQVCLVESDKATTPITSPLIKRGTPSHILGTVPTILFCLARSRSMVSFKKSGRFLIMTSPVKLLVLSRLSIRGRALSN